MPTGFECYNDNGRVQVNSESFLYSYVKKGTHSCATNAQTGFTTIRSRLDITDFATAGVVAFRPQTTGLGVFVYQVENVGSTRRFYIMSQGTTSLNIDWWYFDNIITTPTGQKAGVQVFNQSGQATFSSFSRPMLVNNVIEGTVTKPADGSSNAISVGAGQLSWDNTYEILIPGESGKTLACIQGAPSGFESWDLVPRTGQYFASSHWDCITATSNGGIRYGGRVMDADSIASTFQNPFFLGQNRNALVVNVAGL